MSAAQLLLSSSLPIVRHLGRNDSSLRLHEENYEAANRGTLDLVKSLAERLSARASLEK